MEGRGAPRGIRLGKTLLMADGGIGQEGNSGYAGSQAKIGSRMDLRWLREASYGCRGAAGLGAAQIYSEMADGDAARGTARRGDLIEFARGGASCQSEGTPETLGGL